MSKNFQRKLCLRKKLHKKTSDRENSILKRVENTFAISNRLRHNLIQQRRREPILQSTDLNTTQKNNINFGCIQQMIQNLKYKQNNQVLDTILELKEIVLISETPSPYFLQLGLVQTLIQKIKTSKNEDIIENSLDILINISTGLSEYIQILDGNNAQNIFLKLLSHNNPHIQSKIFEKCCLIEIIKNISFLLLNLFRTTFPPDLSIVPDVIDIFCSFVLSDEISLIIDGCWGIFYITKFDSQIDKILELNMYPALIKLLHNESLRITISVFPILSNISKGEQRHKQFLLNNKILDELEKTFHRYNNQVVLSYVSLIISNLANGTEAQIGEIIDSKLLTLIIENIQEKYGKIDAIKKEFTVIVLNVLENGTFQHITNLIEKGVIELICQVIQTIDQQIIYNCLQIFYIIIKLNENYYIVNQIEKYRGFEIVNELTNHKNTLIATLSQKILQNFNKCLNEQIKQDIEH
ncbi:importin subunit alpha [Anaeramoeba flamelloides]|uniref:Importin subunit alpha n=1 Tax=Anaeramoeba flamelloides TaxID=1746091 RepID=A0AAV7Y8X0_9EUKA|nr:importin subunit alpha [Anaeramoeba flamelloides]